VRIRRCEDAESTDDCRVLSRRTETPEGSAIRFGVEDLLFPACADAGQVNAGAG
jgi:hypothetical protein